MGMYTELNIGVRFKRDTPDSIINAISYMIDNDAPREFPEEHEIFGTDKWEWMLRSAGSYYFASQPTRVWCYDEITEAYFLSVCTNIKNYNGEWEKFLYFIAPYVETEGYIGTYRYEESEHPELLYNEGGRIVFKNPRISDNSH